MRTAGPRNGGTSRRAARFLRSYRTSRASGMKRPRHVRPERVRRVGSSRGASTIPPMPDALPNPLREIHAQAGAEFQPYAELEIVTTFGEPQAEYSAIRKGCGLLDAPQRGILELTGKDRLPFLNNLLTNQTWDKSAKAGLAAGAGVYAYYLNAKGRIVAEIGRAHV